MHSAVQRANTAATIAAILLATICAAASFLDAFNSPSLQAHVQVVKINRFRRQLDGNDEVKMTLKMSMDLTSLFTWNTKQVFVFLAAEYETDTNSLNQVLLNYISFLYLLISISFISVLIYYFFFKVSLWDHIVQEKERASFQVKVPTKYPLIDQGTNLRGKKVGLVLHWHIMPISGRMIQGKMPLSNFSLPDSYTTRS
ncbi:Signal peptidase subunit family protein [Rhynchospora pubera]|uniref:Signal peptidase complex subunit 3 n=1 Tax=Rhynchospora pubera TaxID=906938 RepID=A0AAV8CBS0_9POAL|nr:Signal peptidase subunit family protein [Rhynchospora pubera]